MKQLAKRRCRKGLAAVVVAFVAIVVRMVTFVGEKEIAIVVAVVVVATLERLGH